MSTRPRVWDVAAGKPVVLPGRIGRVERGALSPDRKTLACPDLETGESIRLWPLDGGRN